MESSIPPKGTRVGFDGIDESILISDRLTPSVPPNTFSPAVFTLRIISAQKVPALHAFYLEYSVAAMSRLCCFLFLL
jgi:hypothetical protein